MTLFQAVILGAIEGITEFLPVSSTAHLIISQRVLEVTPSFFFTTVVQMGALAGLIWVERFVLVKLLRTFISNLSIKKNWSAMTKDPLFGMGVATLPVLLVGFFFSNAVEQFHGNFQLIAFMSVVIGIVLLAAQLVANKRSKQEVTFMHLCVMGLFQILALVPGTSRSGVVTAAGIFSGLSMAQALEYSFLLSIPVLGIAGVYELLKATTESVNAQIIVPTGIAAVVACVCAVLAVKALRRTVRSVGFIPFVFYRIMFGAFILLFL